MADLRVEDKYRKNPLSLSPGGYTVAIIFQNGKKYLYDKVKRPDNYVRNISQKNTGHGPIVAIYVEGNLVWDIERGGDPWIFHI